MTKDELIYELTRTFSDTPGETDIFIEHTQDDMSNILLPLRIVEVDTIEGKQRIVLS